MHRPQETRHSARFVRLFWLVFASLLASCADGPGPSQDLGDAQPNVEAAAKGGLDAPAVAVGPFLDGALPIRTPSSPSSSTWDVVSAFPNIPISNTLVITPSPADNRIYVGSRDGYIVSFDNDPAVTDTEPFMDLRDRTAVVWDGGFLGLTFHPEFGVPGSPYELTFYAYYSSYCPLDGTLTSVDLGNCDPNYPQGSTGGFFNTYLSLSRFTAFYDEVAGVYRGDPSSEEPMLRVRLYNGSHRGGGLTFANDGLMYLTMGDQFRYETAQDIENNLEGGVHRLAVDIVDHGDGTWDCPPGSHLPRRNYQDIHASNPGAVEADEMSGRLYCIPDDNPFADAPGPGLSQYFEEYCSLGHRNPHRMGYDPVEDRLWSGEVGQSSREEINVIECGNNYGWPFREGKIAGVRPEPASYHGVLTDPVIDFTRTEARAIIGGYVYRGPDFPELHGRYIAGDYVTNNIWAFTLDPVTMTATKDFLTTFPFGNLGTFGQDSAGNVFMGDVASTNPLQTLARIGDPVPDAPALLSETGAFSDTANLVPSSVWVPYALNQPFWSDDAIKARWIAVPNDGIRDTAGEQIVFSENGNWGYPTGTVLMKHFELPLDENDPSVTTRLETRMLVLGDDDRWYGLTYKWRANQLDADLLTTEDSQDFTIQLAGGGTRQQSWYYPSRLDCLSCHLQVSGGALGPRTHQLNGPFTYPSTGRTDNQLVTWNDLGMFSPALDNGTVPSMLSSTAFSDVTASLEDRARSWLDSNCSNCHRPGGANAGFDARYTTPFENQGFAYGGVRDDLGFPGMTLLTPGDPSLSAIYQRASLLGPAAMPPLAKALVQDAAMPILAEWITRVDPDLPQTGASYEYYETEQLSVLPDFDSRVPVATGTSATFDISVRNRDDDFAFRWTSLLYIETPGDYSFFTTSDDGSQLFLNGALVVDNDGLHAAAEASGIVTNLSAGYHPIVVTMFERGGQQVLSASYQGPDTGDAKTEIDGSRLYLEIPSPVVNEPPVLTGPADQTHTEGEAVLLSLQATDNDGDLLYFDADGLPPGLSVDHLSGEISGTVSPGAEGAYAAMVSASDGPTVSAASFLWTIGLVAGESACDDGLDNDSDGLTDCADPDCDGVSLGVTSCGLGACAGNAGELRCQGGTAVDTCDPLAGATADDASCDGVDDDCDGSTDEDVTPASCSNGAFCDGVEQCVAGACLAGSPVVCDDGVSCTSDSCNEANDQCEFVADDAACDNGLFCDGAETCSATLGCQAGADPCAGLVCDEGNDICPADGCGDGTCDGATEDCNNCPQDCVGATTGVPLDCGDGICAAAAGEDCNSCPQDCNQKTNGNPNKQFCCGAGGVCGDNRCSKDVWQCDDSPSVDFCCGNEACEAGESSQTCETDCGPPAFCGDSSCDGGEDSCSCPQDCGAAPGSEAGLCDDGVDNDCDGAGTDCSDPDCNSDPVCQGPSCGDGVCEPGEDCQSCSDCEGRTTGKLSQRYCCGNGVLEDAESDGRCDGNP